MKAIILDFDGVLVESVSIKHDAFRHLLPDQSEYTERLMDFHRANNGVSRYVKFKYLVENILEEDYTPAWEATLKDRFDRFSKDRIILCPPVPGAVEFLDYFGDRLPLYLASATPVAELLEILDARNLRRYFKKVYGAPSPKTDVIREILSQESADRSEVVFVGDSHEDYVAASTAGVSFIGRGEKTFEKLNVPAFPDLFGVRRFLAGQMGRVHPAHA